MELKSVCFVIPDDSPEIDVQEKPPAQKKKWPGPAERAGEGKLGR